MIFACIIPHNFCLNKSSSTTRKWALGQRAQEKMKCFQHYAPLHEKYGEPADLQDCLDSLMITRECRQVFSCCSNDAAGYNCIHLVFPRAKFQVAKNNFKVTEQGESPLESENQASIPAEGTMATASETVATEDDFNSQILWASM